MSNKKTYTVKVGDAGDPRAHLYIVGCYYGTELSLMKTLFDFYEYNSGYVNNPHNSAYAKENALRRDLNEVLVTSHMRSCGTIVVDFVDRFSVTIL